MSETDDLRLGHGSHTPPLESSPLARIASLILASVEEGIYGADAQGFVTFANPAAERTLGWESVELIGRPMHETLHHSRADGSPYPRDECPIHKTLADGVVHHVSEEVFWRKDGSAFPVSYTSSPMWDDGRIVGAVITFRDQSELTQAETLRMFSTFLDNIPMGVFVIDAAGKPVYANRASVDLLGKGVDPDATPERLADVYKTYVYGTLDEYPTERMPVVRALSGETTSVHDMEIHKQDGNVAIEVWAQPVKDSAGAVTHAIAVFSDITQRKRLEQELAARMVELENAALEDELTGLPNRKAFDILAEQQLKAIGRSQMPATLAIFDLDGLETTSERYGRDLLDQWLSAFGKSLQGHVKRPDFCARIDFDRFALFVFGDEAYAEKLIGCVKEVISSALAAGRWPDEIQVRTGRVAYYPERPWSPKEFIEAAVSHLS